MAPWVVVGVDSSVAWPTSDTEIEFGGYKMTLRPGSKELVPTIAFEYPSELTFDDALLIVRRFMSSLAWVERSAVREEGVTGGSHPIRIGWPLKGNVITHHFRQDYLPAPQDRRVRLALALYREALGLNSVAYAFLGFFKIINLVKKTGREQKDWINAALPSIKDHRALERKNELATTEPDLGAYLYESGRCAVAHAYTEPIADPEDVADRTRLAKDLPLIQALAEHAIEAEFGVQSQDTVWREHLYQLDGFRSVLGPETVDKLKRKEHEGLPPLTLPRLSLRVRDRDQLPSFEGLVPAAAAIEDGVLWLACRAESGVLEAIIGLDLPNELLLFDPERGVGIRRGTDPTSITAQIDGLQLLKDLLCNGSLEIRSADTGASLGRTDPYIGHNIDLAGSVANIERSIEQLRAQLRDSSGGSESSN
jgi:hypothetical protein